MEWSKLDRTKEQIRNRHSRLRQQVLDTSGQLMRKQARFHQYTPKEVAVSSVVPSTTGVASIPSSSTSSLPNLAQQQQTLSSSLHGGAMMIAQQQQHKQPQQPLAPSQQLQQLQTQIAHQPNNYFSLGSGSATIPMKPSAVAHQATTTMHAAGNYYQLPNRQVSNEEPSIKLTMEVQNHDEQYLLKPSSSSLGNRKRARQEILQTFDMGPVEKVSRLEEQPISSPSPSIVGNGSNNATSSSMQTVHSFQTSSDLFANPISPLTITSPMVPVTRCNDFKDKKLNELEQKLKEYHKNMNELQSTVLSIDNKMQQSQQQQNNQLSGNNSEIRMAWINGIKEQAEKQRIENAHLLTRNFARLGYYSLNDSREVWNEGEAFRVIDQKLQKIVEEREQLELKKKDVQKSKMLVQSKRMDLQQQPNASQAMESVVDQLFECIEQEDTIKIRQLQLKREENQIQEERHRLIAEKIQHMHEIKRVEAERQSPFQKLPILQDRYLLTKLIYAPSMGSHGGRNSSSNNMGSRLNFHHSELYKAYDLAEMRDVVVKLFIMDETWSEQHKEQYIKMVLNECQIHRQLSHPHIVQMHDSFVHDANTFAAILEYLPGQTLEMYIQQHLAPPACNNENVTVIGPCIPEIEARNIISQIFSALRYLNQLPDKQQIVHMELSPSNIMIHNGEVKIIDFGQAKLIQLHDNQQALLQQQDTSSFFADSVLDEHSLLLSPSSKDQQMDLLDDGDGGNSTSVQRSIIDNQPLSSPSSSSSGSLYFSLQEMFDFAHSYLPPECFDIEKPAFITSRIDVWSAGLVFYELLYGEKAWSNNNESQNISGWDYPIITMQQFVTLQFPSTHHVTEEAQEFIRQCLAQDGEKRPDAPNMNRNRYLRPLLFPAS